MKNVLKTKCLLTGTWDWRNSRTFLVLGLSAAMFTGILPMGAENPVYESSLISQIIHQAKNVTGTILDENGEPMIGVSVLIQGTTTGTICIKKY